MSNHDREIDLELHLPAADEVRAELKRVLKSDAFQQAGRASRFLRFIVEETLASRGDRLKGYTIAVEVFERPGDFDAQSDPLVRVEAGRLRRRLKEHYLAEGLESPVRIELPRGGYMPSFRYAAPARRAAEPATQRPRDPESKLMRRTAIVAALTLVVLTAFTWLVLWEPRPASPPSAAPALPSPAVEARLLVLPLANLSDGSLTASFTVGLAEETIREFVNLDIIAVASGTSAELTSASLEQLRTEYSAGYVLTGSVRAMGNGQRIAVRLLESRAGTQLWTRTFDEGIDGHAEIAVQEDIATQIAMILASPYGPIYVHELERLANRPTDSFSPFECLVQFYGYVRLYDPRVHAESLACLQRTLHDEPNFATGWSALAMLYLHEHTFGFNPQPEAAPALERALEAVRRSLDIDSTGRAAAAVLLGIRLAAGDDAGFERAVQRALAITPRHPALLAQVGFLLTLSGDWQAGIPLLDRALPLTSNPPGWLQAAYAFRDLQTGQYAGALDSALRINAPNWFVAPMTVAAAAALAGRQDLAAREAARLLELFPDFETAGPAQLEKWNMNDTLAKTMLDGLRLAGLSIR